MYVAVILLLGSFLYFFEIFYHGFEQGDFNRVQIALTFFTFLLAAGFIFAHEVIEKRIRRKDLSEFFLFFVVSVAFLFLIFYTRNMEPLVPLSFAGLYFVLALALNSGKIRQIVYVKVNVKSPMILFSLRFFILLGLIILPAALFELYSSGKIDFRFHSIAIPMIGLITPMVQGALALMGISTYAIPDEGGITLVVSDDSFRVFVGILCSGVTSLSVFVAAFVALAWDLKVSLRKKALMLAIGIGGTILANVFRIMTLFLVGLYYGKDAMILMHTHLGWILYFVWITIFWYIAFRVAGVKAANGSKIQDSEKR